MQQTKGEAVSVNGGEFSDEELEAIRAIRKIQKNIASDRVEEKIEREIDEELNEIVPKNLPDIHENVSYYVNRPDIQPSDKNCYDVIATRYKDVVQSLVKVVKRIIKKKTLLVSAEASIVAKVWIHLIFIDQTLKYLRTANNLKRKFRWHYLC